MTEAITDNSQIRSITLLRTTTSQVIVLLSLVVLAISQPYRVTRQSTLVFQVLADTLFRAKHATVFEIENGPE